MDFNYEQYTIKKLFSVEKVYSVPRFQREYSWSKIELKTFYDDLLESANMEYKLYSIINHIGNINFEHY